jgi:hypothetical protein
MQDHDNPRNHVVMDGGELPEVVVNDIYDFLRFLIRNSSFRAPTGRKRMGVGHTLHDGRHIKISAIRFNMLCVTGTAP